MTKERRKVLLADDNQDGVDTLAAFLEMLGFEVCVARDGGAAVGLAAREMPDLAILDLGMPVLTGWEVCRAIRAMPGGDRVRMVALSGWGSEEGGVRAPRLDSTRIGRSRQMLRRSLPRLGQSNFASGNTM